MSFIKTKWKNKHIGSRRSKLLAEVINMHIHVHCNYDAVIDLIPKTETDLCYCKIFQNIWENKTRDETYTNTTNLLFFSIKGYNSRNRQGIITITSNFTYHVL